MSHTTLINARPLNIDIQALFAFYDLKYFNGYLRSSGKVRWSIKLKVYTGVTKYFPSNRTFMIILSRSLLRSASHEDIISTLIHEMIHAYLICMGCSDGHGPIFQKHASRISLTEGILIKTYHRCLSSHPKSKLDTG